MNLLQIPALNITLFSSNIYFMKPFLEKNRFWRRQKTDVCYSRRFWMQVESTSTTHHMFSYRTRTGSSSRWCSRRGRRRRPLCYRPPNRWAELRVSLSDRQICVTCTCARAFERAQAFVLSVSIRFPLLSGMLFSLRIGFLQPVSSFSAPAPLELTAGAFKHTSTWYQTTPPLFALNAGSMESISDSVANCLSAMLCVVGTFLRVSAGGGGANTRCFFFFLSLRSLLAMGAFKYNERFWLLYNNDIK